jgi:thymidine kinase
MLARILAAYTDNARWIKMAKLYFRYGAVSSAKTLNLLAVAYNYRQQSKNVIIVKPAFDDRFGVHMVQSRAGLKQEADIIVSELDNNIDISPFLPLHCILVDELQFLNVKIIEQLRDIASFQNIPVICYGLRTDFRGHLFPATQRLLELSDTIEEIKTTCTYCNRKAIMNLKFFNHQPTTKGPSAEVGAEEKYLPTCYHCYAQKLHLHPTDQTSKK